MKVSSKRMYSRSSATKCIEKMLDKGSDIIPCACKRVLVQAKARSICEDLSKGDGNVKPFSASIGGFSRFTKRYNFCNIKMTGAAASADSVAVILCTGRGCQSP
jgi:hypothetical protein